LSHLLDDGCLTFAAILQGTRKTATFETLKPQDLRHFGDRWGTIVRTIDFSSASALDAGETEDEYFRLKSLANAGFAKEALRKVTDVILPLNDSGTGPAFYCVHDITGIATGFRFIAEMLGPRQRFYGIQAPTKKRNAEFASSIESISQYYVDDLIKFQPEGNFLLGGYSTGAVIALQMAQQLRARGREVSLLVVFDGDLFNSGAEIKSRDPFDRLELIWNLPRWITAVVKEGYSCQTLCRKAINKAIAAPKAIMAKMRGEVATFELTAENFVSINLNHCSPEHVAFINRLLRYNSSTSPRSTPAASWFVQREHKGLRVCVKWQQHGARSRRRRKLLRSEALILP
jgi:pimeloyl-ACP methyl ester carboxylesterase